eukprot:1830279-Rhodomonas_salina.1
MQEKAAEFGRAFNRVENLPVRPPLRPLCPLSARPHTYTHAHAHAHARARDGARARTCFKREQRLTWRACAQGGDPAGVRDRGGLGPGPVSYTHLRAHETEADL